MSSSGSEGRRSRARLRVHRLLDWVWPSFPTSWAEVPARLRPSATQIARLTVAAVVAYLVADAVSPGIHDLTAPLTALLVVQASTVGTLVMGLVRIGAVLTGVLVAVLVTTWTGLSWWSLALVIAVTLVLAKVFRLGDQSLETPISAMLILAVSAPGLGAEGRLVNTLIGTVVGILFSFLVPVAIPNAQAGEAVRRVARSQAALLAEVAQALGARAPAREEVAAWLEWTGHVTEDTAVARDAVREVEQTRVLNPLALTTDAVHPALRGALDRLERCLAAERALLVVLSRSATGGGDDDPAAAELRRAFAVVLDDAATGLRAFGDLVGAEYDGNEPDRVLARERTLGAVGEARAVLTELTLLDLDPRQRPDLWMLQGSVLASVDHVLEQLDLERATPVHLLRPDVTEAITIVRPTAAVRFRRRWRRLVRRRR
ncbi:FUSC family protein [Amnibacterium kyonggiense]|uniref:Aromatic acid exporter family member 1 n=1 Tax=Amnibacterium kyonggiense TaxID=595671 RepID=A0A4R7FI13_9MICO|nr:FUSC family protein [Amnibacterium kyonggiense]TDS76114.1 aromatic acid exporter family member 1 [Amnibacterium kyonggiense]